MNHETDLLTFLHEAVDLRVRDLTEQAHQQPDFVKVNQSLLDFMESVADENIRAVLVPYEEMKNEYVALLLPYLYMAGAKDSLGLYGLLSKQIYSSPNHYPKGDF